MTKMFSFFIVLLVSIPMYAFECNIGISGNEKTSNSRFSLNQKLSTDKNLFTFNGTYIDTADGKNIDIGLGNDLDLFSNYSTFFDLRYLHNDLLNIDSFNIGGGFGVIIYKTDLIKHKISYGLFFKNGSLSNSLRFKSTLIDDKLSIISNLNLIFPDPVLTYKANIDYNLSDKFFLVGEIFILQKEDKRSVLHNIGLGYRFF